MSFKANLGIILHLHEFKNLGLPHKARYALRVGIYQGKKMQNIAMPFNVIETQTKPRRNVGKESEIEDGAFRSKRFNIEYQDEEIHLNDCCQFKMSLEGFPSLQDHDIYLEFILIENSTCYFREDINTPVDMKEAERYRFKLENLETGIFKYCQGEFSEAYIASFSFTLFLMVTDYRFHHYITTNTDSARELKRQKTQSLTQLMSWGQKYVKNCEDSGQYFYKKYIKDLRYNSSCFQTQVNTLFRGIKEELKIRAPLGQKGDLVVVSDKQFFQYLTNYFPQEITQDIILKEIYRINQQNFYFVQRVSHQITLMGIDLKTMKDAFRQERKQLFGKRICKNVVFGKEIRDKEVNLKIAEKMRKVPKSKELKIIDEYLFSHKKNQHYAFLEINLPEVFKNQVFESMPLDQALQTLSEERQSLKENIPYDERNMLIVLVHGFQASSYDMQLIKRELSKVLPLAIYLVSSTNEINTEGDIALMGFKLAEEIKTFILRSADNPKEVIINFVGHSMGGVISRASLKYLQEYQKQMGFFMSLSSPHLGYLNGVDTMIRTGLWFMRKMNKVKSLDQLLMEDNQQPRESFLFKLSQSGHLRNFRKVILVSSSEDSYVAWHSARLEYHLSTNSSSKLQREMIDNILDDQIVHRIDVHFDIDSTKDMDSFIGRTAHINMLTHDCLFKLINEAVPNLFDIRKI